MTDSDSSSSAICSRKAKKDGDNNTVQSRVCSVIKRNVNIAGPSTRGDDEAFFCGKEPFIPERSMVIGKAVSYPELSPYSELAQNRNDAVKRNSNFYCLPKHPTNNHTECERLETIPDKSKKTSSCGKRGKGDKMIVKDKRYWEKRWRNNAAAKRSRDARRARELESIMKAAFMVEENKKLKDENRLLKENNMKLLKIIEKLEFKAGREFVYSS